MINCARSGKEKAGASGTSNAWRRRMVRPLARVVMAAVWALTLGTVPAAAQTLATYQFGSGPITFGIALPQGAAPSGVRIGQLSTQTDVKTTWPDGSIRFAVVSAQIPSSGSYPITPSPVSTSTFTPAWPDIRLELVINGVTWTASAGTFSASNPWLEGPVVREVRIVRSPMFGSNTHPLLDVIFDIRSYAGGILRIDLTVQNVRDSVQMDKVPISGVSLKVNNAAVWSHGAVTSYSMTRWRHVTWVGATEAALTPDFEPAFVAGVLPRILPTVESRSYDVAAPNYDLMGGRPSSGYPAFAYGEMNPDMGAPGGRQEIGALNWWEAVYLVHKTANQREAVLRNADLTGAWSNHLSKADGSTIKLGESGYDPAQWWWDNRAAAGQRPLAPVNSQTNWQGAREGLSSDTDTGTAGVPSHYDEQHVPAPMFVAYLVSGDRYYVDQARFWAGGAILHATPWWAESDPVNFPGWKRGRNGSSGNERLLAGAGMTREFAWPLRLVAVTAWMLPTDDPDKQYFMDTVQNNLRHAGEYLDTWVRLGYGGALGAIGGAESASGWGWSRNGQETGRYTSQWRLAYTAYSVDWCTRQGLWSIPSSTDAFVNRVVNLDIQMNLQNAQFLSGKSGLSYNYYPVFNTMANGRFERWLNTFDEVKQYNETYPYTDGQPGNPNWNPNSGAIGYYNVEHHMSLQIGIRRGLPNAQLAAQRLAQVPGHAGDLNSRAGFAITFTPPLQTGQPPASPTNLRVGP